MVISSGLTQLPREALPINARAVAPGFPQARAGVCVVSGGAAGQQRVDAVESVGPVQVPAAGRVGLMVLLLLLLAPLLIFHAGGGVAGGLLHAATVLLDSVEGRRGLVVPPQIVLVQLVLAAVAEEATRLLCDVQIVDLQRRARRRGALGLRVQGGRGRRQGALPPDASPLSAAFSLGQFSKNNPRRRCYIFAILAVRVRGVTVVRHKVALVVKVVVDAGVCFESLRGFPNVHPQGIGRSLLLRLDPRDPRIHWNRV